MRELKAAELVKTRPDPSDKRSSFLFTTAKGEAKVSLVSDSANGKRHWNHHIRRTAGYLIESQGDHLVVDDSATATKGPEPHRQPLSHVACDRMANDPERLLEEIKRDALDESVPLATALRKCLILGGESGSVELRDWATQELKGYANREDLPEYRKVPAPLLVDGITFNAKVTRQPFASQTLPEFAREEIQEEVPLTEGVGNIEALLGQAQINLMPPGASLLVKYMNENPDAPYGQTIMSLYWGVSHAAIRGVLDQIRTALVQLVAELSAQTSPGDLPSAEAVDQAVHVMVTGKRSTVNVNTAQATGAGSVATTTQTSAATKGDPWWKRYWKFAVGAAGIVAAVAAVIQIT